MSEGANQLARRHADPPWIWAPWADSSRSGTDCMTEHLESLRAAWKELQSLPFPEHPDDDVLAGWLLDLAELDGHIAGLAATALGSRGAAPVLLSREVAAHAALLEQINVAAEDAAVYDECIAYIARLQRVADALGGRASQHHDGRPVPTTEPS